MKGDRAASGGRSNAPAVCRWCQLSGRCEPERFDTHHDVTLPSVRLSASTDVTATSALLLAACHGCGLHGGGDGGMGDAKADGERRQSGGESRCNKMVRRTTTLHQLNSCRAGKAPGDLTDGWPRRCTTASFSGYISSFETPCRQGAQPYQAELRVAVSARACGGHCAAETSSRRAMAYLLHCNAPRPTAASTY
jgi:hypothetical protein